MLFVIVGVISIALNLAGIGPSAHWNWDVTGDLWKFLRPFGLALAWWTWADQSGYNKRKEMERMEARRQQRRERNLESLGMDAKSRRQRRQGK